MTSKARTLTWTAFFATTTALCLTYGAVCALRDLIAEPADDFPASGATPHTCFQSLTGFAGVPA